jgi:DnaJ-class molecular chaperone
MVYDPSYPHERLVTCGECDSRGWLLHEYEDEQWPFQIEHDPCQTCDGTGIRSAD